MDYEMDQNEARVKTDVSLCACVRILLWYFVTSIFEDWCERLCVHFLNSFIVCLCLCVCWDERADCPGGFRWCGCDLFTGKDGKLEEKNHVSNN